MKSTLIRFSIALGALVIALSTTPLLQAQAEKVKERAKDLKKKVESGETGKTNSVPAKPTPARPAPPK